MKQKLTALLLVLLLAVTLVLPVMAAETYVDDEAAILTLSEIETLEARAAEISEQISTAGKEASGTSNMKLMMNGAVTIGTLDGANVEIREQVGDENMFLFGMTAEEVDALWRRGYDPHDFMTPELERVMRMLTSGVLGQRFDDIYASLLTNRFGTPDSYMTIADFQSYAAAQKRASETYLDRDKFASMMLVNTAKAGIFSSDRAVREYADNIWHL